MDAPLTTLAREAAETPDAARRQSDGNRRTLADLGARLRASPPRFVATGARGSSANAAAYGKHLIETVLGRPVAPLAHNVASVYEAPLDLRDGLFIAVSQGGRSPDLLRLAQVARDGGALVVGIVNDADSPLAAVCEVVLPLHGWPERGVAATKSHLLTGLAFLDLVAHWSERAELHAAVRALPDAVAAALDLDWWPALGELVDARGLFVVGRGAGLGAAQEVALKFKESCGLHAEAFSAAEIIHGPLAMVGPDLPVLALGQEDAAAESIRAAVARMVGQGARVWSALDVAGAVTLPGVAGVPPVLAPLCQTASFYAAVSNLARARGWDPDAPPHLQKIMTTR
ncbi:MAG TPA: SIS domain-containing protein [Azospirillum sp.]